MDRLISLLLVLWFALLGAGRINLYPGGLSFILTPFLVLTPLLLGLELARVVLARDRWRMPAGAPAYAMMATGLLCVIVVSAFFGGEPDLSIKRSVLLILQVYGTLLGGIILLSRERPERTLVAGAYVGLALSTVFNIAQVYNWITGQWESAQPETEQFLNLAPRMYGSILPRLSGIAIDQGLAGFLFVVFLFVITRFAPPSRMRSVMLVLGWISLVGTLARAALLCALVAWGVLWLQRREVRIAKALLIGSCTAAVAAVLLVLLNPPQVETALGYLAPLADRFSTQEGSSRLHLLLIRRGLELATDNSLQALLGVGYGNSMVLQDLFPGSPYANFHSLYITLLAECGLIAFVLGCSLLVYPVILGGAFAPLIAGFLAYNVFYQTNAEPTFWLILALAWFTIGRRIPRGGEDRPLTTAAAT